MSVIERTAAAFAAMLWLAAGQVEAQSAAPAAKPAAVVPPAAPVEGVVNINTATAEELELLPGVGPARARAILEYRRAQGEFKKVDDLRSVAGIGDRAVETLRPHCVLSGKTTAHRP